MKVVDAEPFEDKARAADVRKRGVYLLHDAFREYDKVAEGLVACLGEVAAVMLFGYRNRKPFGVRKYGKEGEVRRRLL